MTLEDLLTLAATERHCPLGVHVAALVAENARLRAALAAATPVHRTGCLHLRKPELPCTCEAGITARRIAAALGETP